MPISAEQWKAVVGSNGIRRPHQIGPRKGTKKPKTLTSKEIAMDYFACCHRSKDCALSSSIVTTFISTDNAVPTAFNYVDCVIHIMPGATTITQLLQSFVSMIVTLLLLLAGDVETNPGPGTILTNSDLRIVNAAVYEVRAKWYNLGVELGIDTGTLEATKSANPHNFGNGLLEMLTNWLKTKEPSWEKLVEALKSKMIGQLNLAKTIEEEHCVRSGGKRLCPNSSLPSSKKSCLPSGEPNESMMRYVQSLKLGYKQQQLSADEGLSNHPTKICRLAMIKMEKVSRRRHKLDDDFVKQTITGKVDDILHMKTPVELVDIFKGVPEDHKIVLVEGAPGAGKSALSLDICKKWSEGEVFQDFKAVILVRLRDPEIQKAKTMAQLLPFCNRDLAEDVQSLLEDTGGKDVMWVLDGWDEFPDKFKRNEECLVTKMIFKHSGHESFVLVTSRPTSSADLHSLIPKRIEVLGFTPDELKQYFEYRFDNPKSVDFVLSKIKEHPEVESSCYLPLHAAFIADTFEVKKDLPETQYGIFETVVMKCISRHQVKKGKTQIQLLSDLTDIPQLKSKFEVICKLAYLGVLDNKIVFTESDIPECEDFETLDLLQEVESMIVFSSSSSSKTYNFLHLSIQEFLAAQHLSSKPSCEQYFMFKGLMDEERCLPMLTYYAAKTKLGETDSRIANSVSERFAMCRSSEALEQFTDKINTGSISFIFRCICEANDPSLCKPFIEALNGHFFSTDYLKGSNYHLSGSDFYMVGSFLSLSTKACIGCNIEVDANHLEDEQELEMMLKGLLRFCKGNVLSPLELTVFLYQVESPSEAIDLLVKILCETNLIFSLMVEFTVAPGIIKLLSDGIKFCKSLRVLKLINLDSHTLTLNYPCIWQKLTACMNQVLQHNSSLDILCLEDFYLPEDVILHTTHTLKEFKFFLYEDQPGGTFFHILKESHIINVTIFGVSINISTIILLAQVIQSNTTIETLKLRYCAIGDENAQLIAQALNYNNTLTKLVLIDCKISGRSSHGLLAAFRRGVLNTLQVWDESILSTISASTDSNTLDLPIDDKGAKLLESLLLSDDNVPVVIEIDVSQLNLITSYYSIFTALKCTTKLSHFRVKWGAIDAHALALLGQAISESKSLQELYVDVEVYTPDVTFDSISVLFAQSIMKNSSLKVIRVPSQLISESSNFDLFSLRFNSEQNQISRILKRETSTIKVLNHISPNIYQHHVNLQIYLTIDQQSCLPSDNFLPQLIS